MESERILDREAQYEAYVDKITRNTPGCYTDKQLVDMSYRERTGIDLDQFSGTDAFSMAHRRGSITLASIMRMARLTRPQRDLLRLIVTARRKGVKLTQAVIAQKLEISQQAVSKKVLRIHLLISPVIKSLDGSGPQAYQGDLAWLFWWEVKGKMKRIKRSHITRQHKTISDTIFYVKDGRICKTKKPLP